MVNTYRDTHTSRHINSNSEPGSKHGNFSVREVMAEGCVGFRRPAV